MLLSTIAARISASIQLPDPQVGLSMRRKLRSVKRVFSKCKQYSFIFNGIPPHKAPLKATIPETNLGTQRAGHSFHTYNVDNQAICFRFLFKKRDIFQP